MWALMLMLALLVLQCFGVVVDGGVGVVVVMLLLVSVFLVLVVS